jgi:hypothetical protein
MGILSGNKFVNVEPLPKKLIDRVRDAIPVKHYSYKTEQSYVSWIVRYIIYHNKRHSQEMVSQEIEAFRTHLAVEHNVAASTQNQADSSGVGIILRNSSLA